MVHTVKCISLVKHKCPCFSVCITCIIACTLRRCFESQLEFSSIDLNWKGVNIRDTQQGDIEHTLYTRGRAPKINILYTSSQTSSTSTPTLIHVDTLVKYILIITVACSTVKHPLIKDT